MVALNGARACGRKGHWRSAYRVPHYYLVEAKYQRFCCSVFFLPLSTGGAALEVNKTPISTVCSVLLTLYYFFSQILKSRCRYADAKGLIGLTSPIL